MEIVLEKKPSNYGLLKVNVKREDFMHEYNKVIKHYSKTANLKGFRPGKVPTTIIEKMYGKSLKQEIFNQEVMKAVSDHLEKNQVKTLLRPNYKGEFVTIEMLDKQNTFDLEFELCLMPEVNIDLSRIKLMDYELIVDDEQVDRVIEKMRNDYSTLVEEESVTSRESIIYGVLKTAEGEIVNENAILPVRAITEDSYNALLNKKRGDIFIFDAETVFLENKDLAFLFGYKKNIHKTIGKFELTINKINKVVPAELNQEFYDRVMGKGIVNSESEFKEKVKYIILKNNEQVIDNVVSNNFYKTLLENVHIDLPIELLRKFISNDKSQEVKDTVLNKFARDLRWRSITNKLNENREITVTYDEVVQQAEKEIKERMIEMGMGELTNSQSVINQFVDDFLQREHGKHAKETEEILFIKKLLNLAKSKCQIERKPISFLELNDLVAKTNKELKEMLEHEHHHHDDSHAHDHHH
ncbi:MAG: trigger factor [Flammeovirgaceae bacterium]